MEILKDKSFFHGMVIAYNEMGLGCKKIVKNIKRHGETFGKSTVNRWINSY